LGDKWHLGYSNIDILANFLYLVNSFDRKPNILVFYKFILWTVIPQWFGKESDLSSDFLQRITNIGRFCNFSEYT